MNLGSQVIGCTVILFCWLSKFRSQAAAAATNSTWLGMKEIGNFFWRSNHVGEGKKDNEWKNKRSDHVEERQCLIGERESAAKRGIRSSS